MIARIWHGWTSFKNANIYENLLKNEIVPSIENKNIKGYRNMDIIP